jgi:hypothetical protein
MGGAMRTTFEKATTLRLREDVLQQIRAIASAEGNHESAVIRRALAAGLAVIADRKPAGSPAPEGVR